MKDSLQLKSTEVSEPGRQQITEDDDSESDESSGSTRSAGQSQKSALQHDESPALYHRSAASGICKEPSAFTPKGISEYQGIGTLKRHNLPQPDEPDHGQLQDHNYQLLMRNNNQLLQIHDLEDRIHQVEVDNGSKAMEIAELKIKLQSQIEHTDKIKEVARASTNRMAYAMENKDLFVGYQKSDEAIYSGFQALIGEIKTWSIPFAQWAPAAHPQDVDTDIYRAVPSKKDLQDFLRSPKNIRLVVRGYVGLVMAEALFPTFLPSGQSGKDLWMDSRLAKGMATIEQAFSNAGSKFIPLRELHDWRALTASTILRLDSSKGIGNGMERRFTRCHERIMALVYQLSTPQPSKAPDNGPQDKSKTLEKGLQDILNNAVGLSQILRCQRASWSVRHICNLKKGSSGVVFDPKTMNDVYHDDESDEGNYHDKVVEVFLSPALFKRGNTHGEHFEVESCVGRSEVKCRGSSGHRVVRSPLNVE